MPKVSKQDKFTKKLTQYKREINVDIKTYSKYVQQTTLQNYGKHSRVGADAYIDILNRGGKRIRGSLVMVGYEMSGGTNHDMILQAARAVEMIHAYVLILDDIMDRSQTRRGGEAAQVAMANYYTKHVFGDDKQHFGESIAATSALLGNHGAQMIMANLDAPAQLKLNAISILNRGMNITVHGQLNDVFNQVVGEVDERAVNNVTEWKTAHYTFLNPLHIGMILAGADCHSTDAITDYAMNMGRAFQLTDDILGTFGNEFDVGKSPLDDIREGKRTLLIIHALKHTSEANNNFLIQMLGNQKITLSQFDRCKDIIIESGALEYCQNKAKHYINLAQKSLNKESKLWSQDGIRFLSGMTDYLLQRTT
ncbi:polyprenyl synthetase family protein [Candidatus Saccharibacteria bacterium]|nr:polyprenyl synthetase family protein [Candidatus Saccharibacteria bacterium]